MTVMKRSTIAICSFMFMLAVVGYINYKYNPEREKNLGKTVYVNGKDSFSYENVSIYSEEEKKAKEEALAKEAAQKEEALKAEQEKAKNIDDTIAVFRYDRDNMFSELIENYSKVIKNEGTTQEQINEYQKKLNNIIEQKNLINMVENVIKSKGIENIVIIPTKNDNLNVVIKTSEEIKPEQIAQIQQILVDQLGADANKISITTKK